MALEPQRHQILRLMEGQGMNLKAREARTKANQSRFDSIHVQVEPSDHVDIIRWR